MPAALRASGVPVSRRSGLRTAFRRSNPVPDLESVVIGVHAVHGDLARRLRKCAIHQADQVHLVAIFIDAERTAVLQFELPIKKLIQRKAQSFYGFPLRLIHSLLCAEVAVFHIVFGEAFAIGLYHTAVRHQKAGYESDGKDHEQGDHHIFAEVVPQVAEKPLIEGILVHAVVPLPVLTIPYHSSASALTLLVLTTVSRICPSRSRTTVSAIYLIASLWVTMITVLP